MKEKWQDKAAKKTREAIREAVCFLMKRKKTEDISITDIHQKTGYSRQTFYRHYDNVQDVLKDIISNEYEGFVGEFLSSGDTSLEGLVYNFLIFCKNNPEKLYLIKNDGSEHVLFGEYNNLIQNALDYVIPRSAYKSDSEFYLAKNMVQGSIIAVSRYWIENGFSESEEEITSFVISNLKIKKGVRKMSIFDNMFFMSVGAVSEMKKKMEEMVRKGKITQEEAQRMFEDLNEGRTLKEAMNPITLSIGFSAYMNQRISELLKDLQEKGKITAQESKEYLKQYIPEEKSEKEEKKDDSEYVKKEDFMKIMEKLEAMEKKLSKEESPEVSEES